MQPEGHPAIVARLRSTDGHLHHVIAIVEAGESCDQVLHQLNAVLAGLRAAGYALLRLQMQQSVATVLDSPCADERQAELEKLGALYQLLTKYSLLFKEVP